jgi:hypothetical protein
MAYMSLKKSMGREEQNIVILKKQPVRSKYLKERR